MPSMIRVGISIACARAQISPAVTCAIGVYSP